MNTRFLERLLIVVLAIGFITELGFNLGFWGDLNQREQHLQEVLKHRIQIQGAYGAVLHHVWIDNPAYVEDVLNETDEFVQLQELLDNDFEDIFTLWNAEDSLIYSTNWENGAMVHTIKHVCTNPDTLPQKAN